VGQQEEKDVNKGSDTGLGRERGGVKEKEAILSKE